MNTIDISLLDKFNNLLVLDNLIGLDDCDHYVSYRFRLPNLKVASLDSKIQNSDFDWLRFELFDLAQNFGAWCCFDAKAKVQYSEVSNILKYSIYFDADRFDKSMDTYQDNLRTTDPKCVLYF